MSAFFDSAGADFVYTAYELPTPRAEGLVVAKLIAIALDELGKTGPWVRQNTAAAAAQLAPIQGLDAATIETGLKHCAHEYRPIDAAVLADQQKIADTFYDLRIISRRVTTKDAVLA